MAISKPKRTARPVVKTGTLVQNRFAVIDRQKTQLTDTMEGISEIVQGIGKFNDLGKKGRNKPLSQEEKLYSNLIEKVALEDTKKLPLAERSKRGAYAKAVANTPLKRLKKILPNLNVSRAEARKEDIYQRAILQGAVNYTPQTFIAAEVENTIKNTDPFAGIDVTKASDAPIKTLSSALDGRNGAGAHKLIREKLGKEAYESLAVNYLQNNVQESLLNRAIQQNAHPVKAMTWYKKWATTLKEKHGVNVTSEQQRKFFSKIEDHHRTNESHTWSRVRFNERQQDKRNILAMAGGKQVSISKIRQGSAGNADAAVLGNIQNKVGQSIESIYAGERGKDLTSVERDVTEYLKKEVAARRLSPANEAKALAQLDAVRKHVEWVVLGEEPAKGYDFATNKTTLLKNKVGKEGAGYLVSNIYHSFTQAKTLDGQVSRFSQHRTNPELQRGIIREKVIKYKLFQISDEATFDEKFVEGLTRLEEAGERLYGRDRYSAERKQFTDALASEDGKLMEAWREKNRVLLVNKHKTGSLDREEVAKYARAYNSTGETPLPELARPVTPPPQSIFESIVSFGTEGVNQIQGFFNGGENDKDKKAKKRKSAKSRK